MGPVALTIHMFIRNLTESESNKKIKKDIIDYLCNNPNPDDLDTLKY